MPYIDWSTPGPNMDALRARTAGQRVALNYFPGTNPNATQEQVAGEILKAMDQIESGEAELVYGIDRFGNEYGRGIDGDLDD